MCTAAVLTLYQAERVRKQQSLPHIPAESAEHLQVTQQQLTLCSFTEETLTGKAPRLNVKFMKFKCLREHLYFFTTLSDSEETFQFRGHNYVFWRARKFVWTETQKKKKNHIKQGRPLLTQTPISMMLSSCLLFVIYLLFFCYQFNFLQSMLVGLRR